MDRREALKRVGVLMGGAVSASVVSGVLAGCRAGGTASYTPQTLTTSQDELVATVAELIIPTTDTPGARTAGVHTFIDQMLTRIYTNEERDRFLAGLADLDARAQAGGSPTFLESTPEAQTAILQDLEAEARAARASGAEEMSFFSVMKELTLVGYYTSEIGATQELKYVHTAGSYDGDVPLDEVGRAYS